MRDTTRRPGLIKQKNKKILANIQHRNDNIEDP